MQQEEIVNNFIDKFSGLTEEYKFYNDTVTLRYQPDEHVYYLLKDGQLIAQDGVTTVCHIIDKSNALVPWAAKMVVEKLLRTVPVIDTPTGEKLIGQMTYEDFEQLAIEAKSAPRDKVEDAADVGHIAHAWIERYIKSILAHDDNLKLELLSSFPDNERSKNCCIAALSWMEQHNVRWISTEKKVYSKNLQFAGTMDGQALVDSCNNPLCCGKEFKDRLSIIDWKSSNYLYIEYLLQTAAYQYATEEEFDDIQIDDRWIIRLGKTDGEFEPWHLERDDYFADIHAFILSLSLYRSVRTLEKRMNIKKTFIKEQKKREKEAAKLAALTIKCKAADKYKGIRPPKCNGGNPCKTCQEIYNRVQMEKNAPLFSGVTTENSN